MTKRKLEDRIKAHESEIQLNKSSTAMEKLNIKSLITIDFKKGKNNKLKYFKLHIT